MAFPVGKAQKQVLDAIGLEADTFEQAERLFADRGIAVGSKRQGRSSVPVVIKLPTEGGGFNEWGEGDVYDIDYIPVDFSKISQWM